MASRNESAKREPRPNAGYVFGLTVITVITLCCMLGFLFLLLRPGGDPGTRVWILNHAPDQVIIVNPFNGAIEKRFQVADGLKDLEFSRDFTKAYIGNMVDVTNKVSVIDVANFLLEESIEIDGIPQGIGVFPDNNLIAVITGSKTDFMAGGFDILDLDQQSRADQTRKKRLYRERDLTLTHKIAIGDDGDRIYCIDAKQSLINVFSLKEKQKVKQIDLNGAPEELLYPRAGDYYYVSVLQHNAIYQLTKNTDEMVSVLIYDIPDLEKRLKVGRLRHMALDSKAQYLYGTNMEKKSVAIWELGNIKYYRPWQEVPIDPANEKTYRFELPHYLPMTRFKLKGGYNPNLAYVPGGKEIAVSPMNETLFVMDEDGALYIYDLDLVMNAPDLSTPEPEHIVTEVSSDVTEIRDMKVSPPTVRETAGQEAR